MPDQYDPKVSPRPTADRRQADARRGATMADDPLAELAKIVQGRPTSTAAQPSRQTSATPAPQSNGAGTSDLEAELLNDLQASFAAVRDVFPPAPPPAAARPPAAAPRAPVVVDETPVAAAPAPQPHPAPRNDTGSELRDEFRLEPVDQTRLVPIPPPPVIQPMIQVTAAPASQSRSPVERPVTERRPEPPQEKIAEPPPVERAPAKPRQAAATPNLGAFQLRGSAAPPAPPPLAPARQPHSRWEQPEPPRAQPAVSSRFAPPRTAAPQMEDEADLDPFAEGGLFADNLEPPEAEDEFQLENLDTLSAYADDEHLPPLEDDLDALSPRRGVSRNLLIVLGVVLIALVGGVGFAMFNGGRTATGGDTPPVIAADGNPTKITPDDTTAAANDPDGQNKLIYDRVNSGDQANTDTTLLTPDNGPIQDVGSDTANNAISRVIIPGGPGIDAPGAENAQQPAAVAPPIAAPPAAQPDAIGQVAANDPSATDPNAIQPIGPRKVRTVIVKPDGTIVSSAATDDTAAPDAAAPAATTVTAAAKPAATDAAPAPAVVDDTAAIAGNSDALPITVPSADGTTAPAADAAPAAVAPAPVVETPPAVKPAATKPAATKPAATKPAAANQQIATADDASPIDIVPGTTAAAPAASGVLVQISSQRTEDAARATYRDLQARYPNILGSYDVNVQRADVPDRGTFYRVRVGPFSQNDAQRLCDDLRQAGGDCVLAKR